MGLVNISQCKNRHILSIAQMFLIKTLRNRLLFQEKRFHAILLFLVWEVIMIKAIRMDMTISDQEILAILKTDGERGFRLLMSVYKEPVYWHIRRLVVTHDDAEDALQDTFLRVFRFLGKFRGDSSLRSWVYRIATNEAFNIIRHRKEALSIDGDSAKAVGTMAAPDYVDYGDAMAVKFQDAIRQLPPKQQAAFNMRYYDDMEYAEIAEAMGSSASSVKANYHFAKDKIIKYMNNNG